MKMNSTNNPNTQLTSTFIAVNLSYHKAKISNVYSVLHDKHLGTVCLIFALLLNIIGVIFLAIIWLNPCILSIHTVQFINLFLTMIKSSNGLLLIMFSVYTLVLILILLFCYVFVSKDAQALKGPELKMHNNLTRLFMTTQRTLCITVLFLILYTAIYLTPLVILDNKFIFSILVFFAIYTTCKIKLFMPNTKNKLKISSLKKPSTFKDTIKKT